MPNMTRKEALIHFGFAENDNPDENAIKEAYKKKAIATHPDKTPYPDNASEEQKKALREEREEAFKMVGQAYAILTNQEQPNAAIEYNYDAAEDLFKAFFGKSSSSSSAFSFDFGLADMLPKGNYQFIKSYGKNGGFYNSSSYGAFNDLEGLNEQVICCVSDIEIYLKMNALYSCVSYEVSVLPEALVKQYDTNHSEPLVEALLKYNKLMDLKAPTWMFSDAQRARLEAHMKPQRDENAKEENAKKARQQKQKKV